MALYGTRCGRCTWPAPLTVCSPYGQRTGALWVPVPPVVGPTMPVRACLLELFLLFLPVFCSSHEWPTGQLSTHTIFSIVKPGNQTRHTYTSKIKGSRSTITTNTTVIITNLPQFLSSEPSPQSSWPSHTSSLLTQRSFWHLQADSGQTYSAEQQRN